MPSTTSKNLGQVAAVISSPTAPTNTNVIWLNTSGSNTVKMIYDPISQTWQPLTQSATVAGDNWGTQVVVTDTTLAGTGITGNVLKIAQQGATSGQIMKWSGSSWIPANPPTGGITSVATDATLKGNGTTGQTLGIAQQNAQSGQILLWNGTAWVPGNPVFNGFVRQMIVMWSGATNAVPTGWNLCDGTNGTPNLQGAFVVGYNPNDGDYQLIGNTGGAKTISLLAAQNGQHNHGISDNGHNHGVSTGTDFKEGGSTGNAVLSSVPGFRGTYSWNTATNTTGITIQVSGTGAPHENRPPYYVLAYIMKL